MGILVPFSMVLQYSAGTGFSSVPYLSQEQPGLGRTKRRYIAIALLWLLLPITSSKATLGSITA